MSDKDLMAAVLLLLYSCSSCESQLAGQAVGYYSHQDGGLHEDDSYAASMDDFPIDTAESQETGKLPRDRLIAKRQVESHSTAGEPRYR